MTRQITINLGNHPVLTGKSKAATTRLTGTAAMQACGLPVLGNHLGHLQVGFYSETSPRHAKDCIRRGDIACQVNEGSVTLTMLAATLAELIGKQ